MSGIIPVQMGDFGYVFLFFIEIGFPVILV